MEFPSSQPTNSSSLVTETMNSDNSREESKDVIVLSDSDEENCEITFVNDSHRPMPANPCTNTPDCKCNTIFKCRLCEFESSYTCSNANGQIQNHLNSHGRGLFIMRESLVTSRGSIFKAVELLPSSATKPSPVTKSHVKSLASTEGEFHDQADDV
jgi:hypothetical protein